MSTISFTCCVKAVYLLCSCQDCVPLRRMKLMNLPAVQEKRTFSDAESSVAVQDMGFSLFD